AVSTVTYLLPVFGTILGVTFLKETLDVQFFIAAILIFSGVLIVNGLVSFSFMKSAKVETEQI
ncbi:MAG: EamA family transporter, partial [Gammaproteobacteria bacterium]|nr:EamA family transporter [Gammaproteobacteria bacterium]